MISKATLYTIEQMKGSKMMSLFMLLDDNSNSFVTAVALSKICCSVKWQSTHKVSVCVGVCMCECMFKMPCKFSPS